MMDVRSVCSCLYVDLLRIMLARVYVSRKLLITETKYGYVPAGDGELSIRYAFKFFRFESVFQAH